MNGSRSTFMRKGYLLTALAAAVLLAASPGPAWAQMSVGFDRSTGTVYEGSDFDDDTDAPDGLMVAVKLMNAPDTDMDGNPDYDGYDVTLTISDGLAVQTMDAAGELQDYMAGDIMSAETMLYITAGEVDDDWKGGKGTLTLKAGAGVEVKPATLAVTIMDTDAAPVAKFSKSSIKLTEDSETTVTVSVEVPKGSMANTDLWMGTLKLTAQGGKVGLGGVSDSDSAGCNGYDAVISGKGEGEVVTMGDDDDEGKLLLPMGAADRELIVKACMDDVGFKDVMITLAFDEKSLSGGATGPGDLMDGGPLMIHVESSGEAVPTVGFTPTDIAISEGGSTRVIIAAEGEHGGEVMMVKLSQEGDAMVDLYDGDMMLEADAMGYIMVDLGDSASKRLTAMSMSDPDLMDGEMKSRTWKIMEADGADIDDTASWLTVTVNGSTAVPALPLVGQLLLALFLMAGGSRLYRRRQG